MGRSSFRQTGIVLKGLIFDIKRFAIHDGPGIRTTVFFKGCPLKCPWCHNPEGIDPSPEIIVSDDRCIACFDCVAVCPKGAIAEAGRTVTIDRANCDLCGECVRVCYAEALEIVGREIDSDELMGEIRKDRIFYEQSGGGATFSGGEPLMQFDFLAETLSMCRDEGIGTVLDTSGFVSSERMIGIAPLVDVFLFDVKHMDSSIHERYTGVPNGPILDNLELLAKRGALIVARFPLVPGFNDSAENIEETASFLASAGIEEVRILPYHKAWLAKYEKLGKGVRPYMADVPSKEDMSGVIAAFRGHGLKVAVGG
ncbi:MAG: hypothetical protein B6D63_03590 [Candidatus Latescibacteria bacterium 4484_7]|nr:MAG: hypothetical protein B6D63_03590 [Candidatus Latescibacteria bacterium 4484_7]